MKTQALLLTSVLVVLTTGCDSGSRPAAPVAGDTGKAAAPASAPAAAPAAPAAGNGPVVAKYGNKTLTEEMVIVEMGRLPERSRRMMTDDGRKRFLENYILTDLLYDEGAKQGFDKDPEVDRQVEDLRRRLIVQKVVRDLQNIPPVTDDDVRKQYDQNPDSYSTTQIKARHILVKDEAKAQELHAQVKADPAKFSEIAKANSTDTASAAKGGDLGFFGRGRMVPEFEKVAFALKSPGEISEIVKTPYGYHIIILDERKDGQAKPFDQVKEQIRAQLRTQTIQSRTQGFYDQLKSKAGISIDEAALAKAAEKATPPAPAGSPGPAGAMGAGAADSPHAGHGH